jgi:hypothetical protein
MTGDWQRNKRKSGEEKKIEKNLLLFEILFLHLPIVSH